MYIRYLRRYAFPNDHGSPAFGSPTDRCQLTTGAPLLQRAKPLWSVNISLWVRQRQLTVFCRK